eukprot:SAG11_NODE_5274_length_1609_cov_1.419868_1_plen_408_part_01
MQQLLLHVLLFIIIASNLMLMGEGIEISLGRANIPGAPRQHQQLLRTGVSRVPKGYARSKSTSRFFPRAQIDLQSNKRVERTIDMGVQLTSYAFFVTLEIGTPPRPFRLNLDTGSSSLYVPADYQTCPSCTVHFDRAYDAAQSSTSSCLACSDPLCIAPCSSICGGGGGPNSADDTDAFLGAGDQCGISETDSGSSSCNRECLEHDTCHFKGDGECDDGSQGGTKVCDVGTDSQDCDSNCCTRRCCSHGSNSCAFQATYGDGSGVAGPIASDLVSFGTGTSAISARVHFGVFDRAHTDDDGDAFEPGALDGIFGIAGRKLDDSVDSPPVLDVLLSLNNLPNIFALCLDRLGTGSTLDIGTLDAKKYVGDMKYVPFHHDADGSFDYYTIDAPHRIGVGDEKVDVTTSDF